MFTSRALGCWQETGDVEPARDARPSLRGVNDRVNMWINNVNNRVNMLINVD